MSGMGILKGLSVTFKHFINSYVADLRFAGKKYLGQQQFEKRQGLQAEGIFTVEYPDEKLAVPERFRFVPFLVVEDADHPERPNHDWCTSCGICAKVCPPQCIWIVRGQDPNTGRPVPEPEAFFIDIDICMNCGFCAEFCPFDAIKMDHDYEMASYDRTAVHIHDKARLSKPLTYWRSIAPTTALEEATARGGWEHPDIIKAMKKAGQTPAAPTVENARAFMEKTKPAAPPPPAPKPAPAANAPVVQGEAPAAKPAPKAEAPAAEAPKGKFDKQAMLAKIRERKANKQ
ncbi:MAG: 4Fe-4S binding protein [Chloroflexi bacterium]|nr:4Fe-4S binding protein [Chloroflexota bacterium]